MAKDFHQEIELEQGSWRFKIERACEANRIHGHIKPHVLTVLAGRVLLTLHEDTDFQAQIGEAISLGVGESYLVPGGTLHMAKAAEAGTEYECDFGGEIVQRYSAQPEAVA